MGFKWDMVMWWGLRAVDSGSMAVYRGVRHVGIQEEVAFRAGFCGGTLTPMFAPPQSYIQSFRDRQTGSSLSSFMASPTDADYEYGSRGPLTACSGPPVRV